MPTTLFALLALTLPSGMVHLAPGSYRPLYASSAASRVAVRAFALDRDAITNGQYLIFVRHHREWARSSVARAAADASYLASWTSDLSVASGRNEPVTNVSWFAANAYCAAQGKRLPTVDEWEYAATADARRRDASADPAFRAAVLAAYSSRHVMSVRRQPANAYGVRGLHDRVWEWTLDFNASVAGPPHAHSTSNATAHEHHAYCASAAIGAGDPSNYPAFMREAVRASLTPRSTLSGLGFRCAAS